MSVRESCQLNVYSWFGFSSLNLIFLGRQLQLPSADLRKNNNMDMNTQYRFIKMTMILRLISKSKIIFTVHTIQQIFKELQFYRIINANENKNKMVHTIKIIDYRT